MSNTDTTKVVLLDGQTYERQANGTLVPLKGETDWAALDALTDEQIEAAAEGDPDARPMKAADWKSAHVYKPGKGSISIRIDMDVLEYFRSKPGKYQSNINIALRRAMESERKQR